MIANIQNLVSSWVFNKTDTRFDIIGCHTVHIQVQKNAPVNLHNFIVSETDCADL